MVRSCYSAKCRGQYAKGSQISFHKFPPSESLKKQWLTAVGRPHSSPSASSVVCSRHFTEEDFLIFNGKRRLKENAVPSIATEDNVREYNRKIKTDESGSVRSKLHSKEIRLSLEEYEKKNREHALETADNIPQISQSELDRKSRKRRAPVYFGDFKEHHLSDPKMAKRMWQAAKAKLNEKNRQLKFLRCANHRLTKRITKLRELMQHLQKKKV